MTTTKNGKSPNNAFLLLEGQVFLLDRPVISIGRGLGNRLVIQNPAVSRIHANMVTNSRGYTIIDQQSTGGTYVNGERIKIRLLQSGDIVRLADFSMVYVDDSPGPTGSIWRDTRPLQDTIF